MSKIILLTGATDGIGLTTAKKLARQGHTLLIHGRNPKKLKLLEEQLRVISTGKIQSYCADLSHFNEVESMIKALHNDQSQLDVLINNAGVFSTPNPITQDNLDVRFVVNTFAPYLLSKAMLPIMNNTGRIINLSSAAQSPVDLNTMIGKKHQEDPFNAYAQSKLAITMWSRHLAQHAQENNPAFIAVNPGSLLASNMVKESFGIEGKDINIGADILVSAALDEKFNNSSGRYYNNDSGDFTSPHEDALDDEKNAALVETMEKLLPNFYTHNQSVGKTYSPLNIEFK